MDLSGSATTVRRATWMVYKESCTGLDETWSGQGYATGSSPSYTYTLVNPVQISRLDKNGRAIDSISSARSTGSGKLQPTDTFAQTDWSRWTHNVYSLAGQLVYTRTYHTIPTSGSGSVGTNYDESFFGYDPKNRLQIRVKTPGGTISRSVYDNIRRMHSAWVGTDDIPTGSSDWEDWSPDNTVGTNLVQISENEYDHGEAGGDSNLTKSTQFVGAAFTPLSIADLTVWLDAQDLATLFQTSGGTTPVTANSDPVGRWEDKSGNSFHYVQSTSGDRGTYLAAGINSLPSIDFDGTSDHLANDWAASNLITSSAFELFVIFKADSITGNETDPWQNVAVWCDRGGYVGVHLKSSSPDAYLYNYDGTADTASKAISTATPYIFGGRHESGSIVASVNCSTESSTASGNTSSLSATTLLGRNWIFGGSTNRFFDGKIGELIIFDRALTEEERSRILAYLADKWSIGCP